MHNEITAIIQARYNSKRLRGKIFKKIKNKSVLETLIYRIKKSKKVDNIIIACSKNRLDNKIIQFCKKNKIDCFRGSENNVLDRYYCAAKKFKVKHILRITSDCPLIDPKLIDRLLNVYHAKKVDFVSNVHPPTFPNGMDIEIFNFKTLKKIKEEAYKKHDLEHVTSYIKKNNKFSKINITCYM